MTLIDRLHGLCASLGISPKVADPFLGAITLALANLIVTGSLDVDGLRIALAIFLLGLVGVAAPPSLGVTQDDVERKLPRRPRP